MRVAITGGTGFVGRNVARVLSSQGHEAVLIARGVDTRDLAARQIPNTAFVQASVTEKDRLAEAFSGCDAVVHCAGINREIGLQTYANIHVLGTQNVVEAAREANVRHVALLSFLRARPNCDSGYHESKFVAEEIVRTSGLAYTIFKPGVIYGRGDHMLDHLSHALYTFPIFLLVGFEDKPCAPLAVEDLAEIVVDSLTDPLFRNKTFAVIGPETITLRTAVARVAYVLQRHPFTMRAPITVHRALACLFERTMHTPLASQAQVRILSESLVKPAGTEFEWIPEEFKPQTSFTNDQIRNGLPAHAKFGRKDCYFSFR